MRGVITHAALLVVALVVAFITWTASDNPEPDSTLVEIWNREPAELTSVRFQAPERTLLIERRGERGAEYLWGTETVKAPASFPADTTGQPVALAPAAALQTEEYPLGEQGTALLERLARLQAERDLGEPEAEDLKAYGLTDSLSTITLVFRSGERVLTVGGTVVGGGHRYVLDRQAGKVYVLPSDLLQPLEYAGTLRLSRLIDFEPADVRGVVLRAGQDELKMQRQPTNPGEPPVWTDPASGRSDQTFANFMDQLDRLFVTRYRPNIKPGDLQSIVRADYLDARGDTLGTVELFRTPGPGAVAYFLQTRSTIVPGEAYSAVAERIEQDLRTIFSGPR